MLRRVSAEALCLKDRRAIPEEAVKAADAIIDDVARRGWDAVIGHAKRLGDLADGSAAVMDKKALLGALDGFPPDERNLLERVAGRIEAFAKAQAGCLKELEMAVPGGRAGHAVSAAGKAGCYAPGGRYPLPSSVLMTAVTARAAGVGTVWVASPRPAPATIAAAAIAGADALLCVGGPQAVAAMALGVGPVPRCDVIAGPGNRYVAAAKQRVSAMVAVDMIAGPSEVVVVADGSADASEVAADLLAQAEHDPDAMPVLISIGGGLPDAVDAEIERQLRDLPTAGTAAAALANGFVCIVPDIKAAAELSDRISPEHLELIGAPAGESGLFKSYGALFLGRLSGEVIGDYGIGPNHTLPTGGSARYTGGLSVFNFLKVRTWLCLDDPEGARPAYEDAVKLARIEGLEAHARSAVKRLKGKVRG